MLEEVFGLKTEDEAKEFILNQMYQEWIEQNPGLEGDIFKLSHEIAMFNIKWGTKLNLSK